MTNLKRFDDRVWPQFEAAKHYLVDAGFAEVHDDSKSLNEHLYTIFATCERGRCILRLNYYWLRDRDPAAVRRWLTDKMIAESMLHDSDADEVIVGSSGVITFRGLK